MAKEIKISIVIPAYNEEKRIRKAGTLDDYGKFFSVKNAEIIVVLNNCTDNTIRVVKEYEKKYKIIRHIDLGKRQGKGTAIIEGFRGAKGELIGFADADNSTSAREFYKLIEGIKDYDGAIASRYIRGSKTETSVKRRIISATFNFLVRSMFFIPYRDTQCGAKLFRKAAAKKIVEGMIVTNWAMDIDMLYKAKIYGYRIKEIPVTWTEEKGSRLNIIKDSIRMLFSVLQLRIYHSAFRRLLQPLKIPAGIVYRILK